MRVDCGNSPLPLPLPSSFYTLYYIAHPPSSSENAMSAPTSSGQPRKVVPAHLGFLAIYNPSLGTTDETLEDQIVYYSPPNTSTNDKHQRPTEDWIREQHNEQLRQIGLAQGMIEFGKSFSNGKAVDTVETEKSRIVLHELEAGWWILAVIYPSPQLCSFSC